MKYEFVAIFSFYLYRYHADTLLELFDDLELILASGKNFLLGRWIESAKGLASNDEELRLYEYNARNQITLWGPRGEIRDYANKQWSGIAADYFKRRWNVFLDSLENVLTKGTTLNITRINERMFQEVEKPFTLSTKLYPTDEIGIISNFSLIKFGCFKRVFGTGDCVDIATKLLSKWHKASYKDGKMLTMNRRREWGSV